MIDFFRFLRSEFGRWKLHRRLERRFESLRLGMGVTVRSPERLTVGRDVRVDAGVVLHCGGMEWSSEAGGITLGSRVYIGPNCTLFGAGGIRAGDDVLISPGVVVTSHQHTFAASEATIREQALDFGPVTIEDDVWVAADVFIGPGVTVGRDTVVGSRSTVMSSPAARACSL